MLFAIPIISNASEESCNALLNVGLYNTSISSSSTDAQTLALSTFCSADYSNSSTSSSQSAQIEASYGLFSGGAGGSASRQDIITKQSQVCTSGFNSSAYSNKASSYSRTMYQGALDAWNKCQQMANQGLVFSIQPSSTMQGVTVLISAQTGLSATYYGVEQFGSGTSTCTTMANGKVLNPSRSKPFEFSAAGKVTVTCKRNLVANGSDLSADAQDLVYVTSADSLTVPLTAIGSFSRVTSDKIKNEAAILANTMLSGAVVAFSSPNCPPGWDIYNKSLGRTIIGMGKGDGLTERTLESIGGVEKHQLTVSEMPSHSHKFDYGAMDMGQPYTTSIALGKDKLPSPSGTVNAEGGNAPHENMQPWVALQYCIKK